MTNKEKKLEILKLLDFECKRKYRDFLLQKADEEAHIAGFQQWEREHPDDGVGGFSGNRWNPQGATANRMIKEKEYKKYQELCDFALISLID